MPASSNEAEFGTSKKVDLWVPCGVYLIQIGRDWVYLPCQVIAIASCRQTGSNKSSNPLCFSWQKYKNTFFLPCSNSHTHTPALCLYLNASHFSTFHISIHFLFLSNNHAPCLNPSAGFISLQVSELPGMKWHEAGERDVIIHSSFSPSCKLSAVGEWEVMES